jgi:cyclophilin family peptidyl-prolyl cis-trans isomerase
LSAVPSEKRERQRAGRAARVAELQKAQQRRRRMRWGVPAVIIAVALALAGAIYSGTRGSSNKTTTATSTPATTTAGSPTTAAGTPPTAAPVQAGTLTTATPCPKKDGTSPHITKFKGPPPNCLDPGKTYTASFITNVGVVTVKLDTTKTPMTANNFIVLSRYHYYDGTAIFRTDTSIDILQGGSPHTQDASDPGPGYTIKDEGSGYTYVPGDLTMARTAQPNSASAQYFFCAGAACSQLNSQGTYVNFGKVTTGLPVLEHILSLNQNTNTGLGGAPSQLITVNRVIILEH